MEVFRIAKKQFAADLTGTGSARFGGRWNKKGRHVIYASESIALALLEVVVHTPPMIVPDLTLLTLEFPDDCLKVLDPKRLPSNWAEYPAPSLLTELTESWLDGAESLALQVPSCLVPTESNFLLNCFHPDFSKLKTLNLEPFIFNPRLRRS